ncbi:Organic radical activating enzyme [Methanocella sp. CWC-04]|uniref:7-carboxy-7-deazaguanine synthase n=1 Tax=Methanooceanicella nereidis TaxID=2052831 RepID=A0AAP2RCI4_9EURY|nr:7-carboxy-7-deazaguanine synthase QueE [Methanocella sp. CWC-04]MCD1294110.1 Organic radical activating enzyme [Methanocella sp. CWC-04]
MRSPVREIFVSVQGEGPYAGYRQIFVRFPKCNLECLYCDTPKEWDMSNKCMIQITPGVNEFKEFDNPLSNDQVLEIIKYYNKIHSVSLTGGEPLLYARFIKELKYSRYPLYLESNMTLPEGAKEIKDIIKYVAGDFKLKTHCDFKGQYEKVFNDTARSFSILRKSSFRDCFCKMIITKDDEKENMLHALDQIKGCLSTLILQPVTPAEKISEPVPVKKVMEFQEAAMDVIEDVRVIPQTHKMWGCL